MFSNVLPALPLLKSGRMRALAVSTLKRSPVLPDVPTVSESGLPGFEVYVFYGLVAPAGTPKDIVYRLHQQITQALDSPEITAKLAADGADPMRTRDPDEFTKLIKAEWDKWSKLTKAAGIRDTEGR
jgi:tripartite-type tricarboxylate transporter receptor subunit TctC